MNESIETHKYVIRDKTSGQYLQVINGNNTVYMTVDPEYMEIYKLESAKSALELLNEFKFRYYNYPHTFKKLNDVQLEIGTLHIIKRFEKI